MKLIPLTQGQHAIVDDENYDELSQFKWQARWSPCTKSYYASRSINLTGGKWRTESMHRRILGLTRGDKRQGDHINHQTLDNRRTNLRIVTATQNKRNNRAKGYCWNKQCQKYAAGIRVNGVKKHLGLFDTRTEARTAYLAAKVTYHPSAPVLRDVPNVVQVRQ